MSRVSIVSMFLILALSSVSVEPAMAQPSKNVQTTRHTAGQSGKNTDRLETIQPKEKEDKANNNVSDWNGSYVGLNAGAGFGATAGANVVVPLGATVGK